MNCPICGARGTLLHDTRNVPYAYNGEQTTLSAIEGDFCSACGEIILDRDNAMRYGNLIGEFKKNFEQRL